MSSANQRETLGVTLPASSDASSDVSSEAPERVQVPGYVILRELGRGAMGVVYLARDERLQRLVALKMILAGGHAGPKDLERFRTEALAIARLVHSHIVQIYEIGDHDGLPYFALEFCPGGSLDRRLAGTPLPAKQAAALVQTLAEAMQAAHSAQVLHRDLKPANVLLTDDGTPKITDFGLAKKLDEQGQTASGAVMGTPSYMASEQARGQSNIGPPADIYSLGAILYECLTGRPPFRAATVMDTLLQVLHDDPVPPRRLNPSLPADLEIICLKCLAKEPGRRYASAQALADDLRRFLAGEPIQARPVGTLERATKWIGRNRSISLAIGLALLTLIAGTLVSATLAVIAGERSKRAIQAEEKMGQALAEAETTLAESLLRPIGTGTGPITALELTALERLADQPSKGVRLRFLQAALAEPDAALRITLRIAPVARALVGTDRSRKARIEQHLAECLADATRPRHVHLACVNLAGQLGCENADLADRAIERLLPLTCLPNTLRVEMEFALGVRQEHILYLQRGNLEQALSLLSGVVGPITPEAARRHVETILDQTSRLSDPVNIRYQGQLIESLLPHLEPSEASDRADRFITRVLESLPRYAGQLGILSSRGGFQSSADFTMHLQTLSRVVRWLTPAQAEAQGRAYLVRLRELGTPDSLPALLRASTGLRGLLDRMAPESAQAIAEELVELVRSGPIEPGRRSRNWESLHLLALLRGHLKPATTAALWEPWPERLRTLTEADLTRLASDAPEVFPALAPETAQAARERLAERLTACLEERPLTAERAGSLARSLRPMLEALPAETAQTLAERVAASLVPLLTASTQTAEINAYSSALTKVAPLLSMTVADRHLPVSVELRPGPFPPVAGTSATAAQRALSQVLVERCSTEKLLAKLQGEGSSTRPALLAILRRRVESATAQELPNLLASFQQKLALLAGSESPNLWSALVARLDAEALRPVAASLAPSSPLSALLVVLPRLPAEETAALANRRMKSLVEAWLGPARLGTRTYTPLEDVSTLAGFLTPEATEAHAGILAARVPKASAKELAPLSRRLECLLQRLPEADRLRKPVRAALLARLAATPPAAEYADLAEAFADLPADGDSWQLVNQSAALQVLSEVKRADERLRLVAAFDRLAVKVPKTPGGELTQEVGRALSHAVAKDTSPLERVLLARALAASAKPFAESVKTTARELADALVQVWDDSPDETLTEQTLQALAALAPLLSADRLETLAERALTALRRERIHGSNLGQIVGLLRTVTAGLPATPAGRYRVATVRALLGLQLSQKKVEGGPAWETFLPACSEAELQAILRSPACLHEAEAATLAELARRRG